MRSYQLILWLALLVGPVMALIRLGRGTDPWILVGGAIAINVVTYLTFAADKRRAQRGEWRVAESALHGLELLGGWPAAFIAQRRLHHKTSKRSYQCVFWMIVLAHEYLAIDYATGWRLSRSISEAAGLGR